MFVDTSGLLVYFDARADKHAAAVAMFTDRPVLATHSGVLLEFVPLCRSRNLNLSNALAFLIDLVDNPSVDVVWVDEELLRAAILLLQGRRDKTYSLCDAISFLLMRKMGLTDSLTTDRHFEQEGFVRLLK